MITENPIANMSIEEIKAYRGPGWVVSHPDYGKWYLPKVAVSHDYAQCMKRDPGGVDLSDEALEEASDSWLGEQIGWSEVYHYGTQLERVNLARVEAELLSGMRKNTDTLGHHGYEEGPAEVETFPDSEGDTLMVEAQVSLPTKIWVDTMAQLTSLLKTTSTASRQATAPDARAAFTQIEEELVSIHNALCEIKASPAENSVDNSSGVKC